MSDNPGQFKKNQTEIQLNTISWLYFQYNGSWTSIHSYIWVFSGTQQKRVAVQWEIVLAINYDCVWARHLRVFFVSSNLKVPCFAERYYFSFSQVRRSGSRQHLCGAALSYCRVQPGSTVGLRHPDKRAPCPVQHMLHESTQINPLAQSSSQAVTFDVMLMPHLGGRRGAEVKWFKINIFNTIPDTWKL
jgi:hypothetical protein